MSQPQRNRSNQRRRPRANATVPADVWRAAEPLPEPEPITATSDVGALLRSLGDPPVGGLRVGHYFNTVIERAAALAIAVAFSADALATPDDDAG